MKILEEFENLKIDKNSEILVCVDQVIDPREQQNCN